MCMCVQPYIAKHAWAVCRRTCPARMHLPKRHHKGWGRPFGSMYVKVLEMVDEVEEVPLKFYAHASSISKPLARSSFQPWRNCSKTFWNVSESVWNFLKLSETFWNCLKLQTHIYGKRPKLSETAHDLLKLSVTTLYEAFLNCTSSENVSQCWLMFQNMLRQGLIWSGFVENNSWICERFQIGSEIEAGLSSLICS